MKVDMSCTGQKKPLPQDSQYGYEELTKVEGSNPGRNGEALLPRALAQEGICPQCRRVIKVVYATVGLVVLCLGLILGVGLVQYMQYKDTLEVSQRLETFCPASGAGGTAGTADPGEVDPVGGKEGIGKPPRGAGVPGGPWDFLPPTAPNSREEDEDEMDDEDWGHRDRRSASAESSSRTASGGRRTRHSNRKRRCISCPSNMTTVEHLEGHPNSVQKTGNYSGVTADYGGADPRFKDAMFKNWRLADWSTGVKNIFNSTTGVMTIEVPGLYWVYGQIMFYNSVLDNGFAVKVQRYSETGPSNETLAMCIHTTDYNDPNAPNPDYNNKYRTCNVGLPAMLNKGDIVWLTSLYEGRKVVFSVPSSFWGLVHLS